MKVQGTIMAGFPSPAEEELQDTMTLDEWLIENKEATYMLKAESNTMSEAGILAGDTVLVDRSKTPRAGDIVISETGDGWEIKYFNKYKPEETPKIAAVVICVIRKY